MRASDESKMRATRSGLAVWICLVVALVAGCREPRIEPARNVILILIDTLRSDRLGAYGYDRPTSPHLDALAAEGAVFLRHYSQGSHTRAAMPSLVYSRYFAKSLFPASAKVPMASPLDVFQQLDEGAISLPELMAASGRRTVLVNTHPWLQPRTEFARLFGEVRHISGHRDFSKNRGGPMASADMLVDSALGWLDGNGDEPFFMHLHLMDPHEPVAFDEYAEAALPAEAEAPEERWEFRDRKLRGRAPTEEEKELLSMAYDGSVRYADAQLGRFFDALAERGLLDETLVVVTSDHGEALYEYGQRRGHGGAMMEPVARVPLIVRYPAGVEPARIEELSQSVDVLPTVATLAGAPLPEGTWADGIDLTDERRRRERRVVAGGTFVRSDRYKIVFTVPPSVILGPRGERARSGGSGSEGSGRGGRGSAKRAIGKLYDLEEDPRETRDLWARRPEEVERLLGAYREALEVPFRRFVDARADVQPEYTFAISMAHLELVRESEEENLESLGWTRKTTMNQSWIHAKEAGEPIVGEIRLPSGRYLMTAFGWGSAAIEPELAAGCDAEITGLMRFEQEAGQPALKRLGEVEVCDAKMRLRIEPDGDTLLAHFGFRPMGAVDDEVESEERDQTLEALGYVN